MSERCPLYPKMQTFVAATGMSALCQKRTFCAAAELALFDQNVLCFSPHSLHMYGTRTCP